MIVILQLVEPKKINNIYFQKEKNVNIHLLIDSYIVIYNKKYCFYVEEIRICFENKIFISI